MLDYNLVLQKLDDPRVFVDELRKINSGFVFMPMAEETLPASELGTKE